MKTHPAFAARSSRDPRSRLLYVATVVVALAAAAGLAACEPRVDGQGVGAAHDPVALAGTGVTDSAHVQREIAQLGSAGNAAQDAAISATVQSQFALDSELRTSGIHIDTFQGRVALHGVAPNAAARERAAQIAASVDGVRSIDNRLDVPTA